MILFNLVISCMLVSLIWIIQVVHYPSFRFISKDQFTQFESFHTRAISFIVIPLMLFELVATTYLIVQSPTDSLRLISGVIVILIWFSTTYFSIPCHNKLLVNHDEQTIEKLIKTNWTRTLGWSFKLIIALYLQAGDIYG